jgi:hypothetical protein
MNNLFFNQEFNRGSFNDQDVLSAFRQQPERVTEIRQGMTAKEISEVVSDRLIAVVKEQFDAAKKQFEDSDR